MRVSVVISARTLARWDDLRAAVDSVADQTAPPDETLVVVDHNEDLLVKATRELAGVRVVANARQEGAAGARQCGIDLTTGDVVAFLDEDAYGEPEWLARLVEHFEDPTVAGADGWVVPSWEGDAPAWFPEGLSWALGGSRADGPDAARPTRIPLGANVAIRREAFARASSRPLDGAESPPPPSTRVPAGRFVLARGSIVHLRVPASRLTWRYLAATCWKEGRSRAALVNPGAATSALVSECRHVARAVSPQVRDAARSVLRSPLRSLVTMTVVIAANVTGAAGFFWGAWRRRRSGGLGGDPRVVERDAAVGPPVGRGSVDWGESPPRAPRASHAPGDDAPRDPHELSPVTLVRVDLDDPNAVRLDAALGDRIWVEVVKGHRVIGVTELRAGRHGVAPEVVEELAQQFDRAAQPTWARLPEELLPRATVVIATIYERPELLARGVASLLAMDYPDFEVIVVDNRRAPDATPIPAFPGGDRVRVVVSAAKGTSAARNYGISLATGEFVAFTDDDAVVEPGWLRALASRFTIDAQVDAIGGMVRPMELDTRPQLWFEEFYGGFTKSYEPKAWSLESVGDSDKLFPYSAGHFGAGVNMAVRRTTLERLGGFDTNLGGGTPAMGAEDLALFLKIIFAGGTVAFEPSALVRHSHRRTEDEFLRQVYSYGVGLTAMFTNLILHDPRHLFAIARRVPTGLRLLLRPVEPRSPSSQPSFPRRTQIYQLLGMAYGPVAYVRSALRHR